MSANTISNNKISNIVNSQVPFFVRNDHQQFIKFLEAYYRYLEQNDKVINRIKNLQRYYDIDLTEDIFAERMYKIFLKYIPNSTLADKKILLKNIKDFYRAKGSEKSVRFLMNILFDELPYDIYYPKKDILRASDGKWYIKKSVRITDVHVDGVANTDLAAVHFFVNSKILGNTSNATAIVEDVDRFYESNILVDELILSNIDGNFVNGEQLFARFDGLEKEQYVTANVYGGQLAAAKILTPGSLYEPGTIIPFESGSNGSGGIVAISKVSKGILEEISVLYGGAGYQANKEISILAAPGDITGAGAKANIFEVELSGTFHPNSYNVMYSTISLVANDILDYANVYSNLNNSNVNTSIGNATNSWAYTNTGPILTTIILDKGSAYSLKPQIIPLSNTEIIKLGILGRLAIVDGGVGYQVNDVIKFDNVRGGFGSGAQAKVLVVNTTGHIDRVEWDSVPGQPIGGSGYDNNYLPKANIISQNVGAYGANIITTCIVGTGASLVSTNVVIGAIETVEILSRGSGYVTPPTLNLKFLGDGTAVVNVSVLPGIITYPGRYLNDDGHISSYNFLEDRDYYQLFSYVIRSSRSVEEYRNPVKDLIHPAGMKLFGEYILYKTDTDSFGIVDAITDDTVKLKIDNKYSKNLESISINYASHGFSVGNTVTLEFTSGDANSVSNGFYVITSANTNYFEVKLYPRINTISIVSSGSNYSSDGYLSFYDASNVAIKTLSDSSTNIAYLCFANSSNLTVNTASGVTVNTSNLTVNTGIGSSVARINLSDWLVNSNVTINANDLINVYNTIVKVSSISLETKTTSNLTVSTGQGASVNLINLSTWTANSNVEIKVGYLLNVDNTIVTVMNLRPQFANQSNLVVNTGIGLDSVTTINLSHWAANSNVLIKVGYLLNVNNKVVTITTVSPTSNVIKVRPGLDVNLRSNIAIITEPPATLNVSPGLRGNLISNTMIVIEPAASLIVTPGLSGNITSNTLQIIKSDSTVSTINLSAQAANSSVKISNGDYILIGGKTVVNVVNTWATSNIIYISPVVSVNLKMNTLHVYESAWAGNSNVTISNGDIIFAHGRKLTIANTQSNSNLIYVSPALLQNLAPSFVYGKATGSNANAQYMIDSSGSIVSVYINNYGSGYTKSPTVLADGNSANTTNAVFSLSLKQTGNTSGNVIAGKINT